MRYTLYVIGYISYAIRYTLHVTRYTLYVIRYTLYAYTHNVIRHMLFTLRAIRFVFLWDFGARTVDARARRARQRLHVPTKIEMK